MKGTQITFGFLLCSLFNTDGDTDIDTHPDTGTYKHRHRYTQAHTHTGTHRHTHTYMYTQAHTHTHIHEHRHTHTQPLPLSDLTTHAALADVKCVDGSLVAHDVGQVRRFVPRRCAGVDARGAGWRV